MGASSTYFDDYPRYWNSLLKIKETILKYDVKLLYVGHSMSLTKSDIALPALPKVQNYIDRRSLKDAKLEKMTLKFTSGRFTL